MEKETGQQFRFDVGQVVHHKRYDYRGVIYARDGFCKAEWGWYYSNQTQPPRDQPWYHVLVDGSDQATYVAESNLESDGLGEPVEHPLLGRTFQSFSGGRYSTENLN